MTILNRSKRFALTLGQGFWHAFSHSDCCAVCQMRKMVAAHLCGLTIVCVQHAEGGGSL